MERHSRKEEWVLVNAWSLRRYARFKELNGVHLFGTDSIPWSVVNNDKALNAVLENMFLICEAAEILE